MTTTRYLSYKRLLGVLDALPVGVMGDGERDLLADCAEGLLLTREGDDAGREDLLDRASLVLSMLFGAQRITAAQSERLWAGLTSCGPAMLEPRAPRRASFSAA